MITIATLMAGRFYAIDSYFWGIENIDYPKDKIHLLFMTNSDNNDFKMIINSRIEKLNKKYASINFIQTDIVPPSHNAFIDKGTHLAEHADIIATLYNELYKHITTEDFLFLEDDVIAPSNAIKGLMMCYSEKVGYVCGVCMSRHGSTPFMWDLIKQRVYPEGDSCNTVTYAAAKIRKPYGIQEIGLGHFGLTLLKRSICDQFKFKPRVPLSGPLVGCDMVFCVELEEKGYKKICNFDVRALHMDSRGVIH